jgi:RNA polymerase sigma-70 factor (ECF subfamily)
MQEVSGVSRADDEVVTRAKSGDQWAWRELYTAHAGRLLLWLTTIELGHEAEDVAAEAWTVAASKVNDFKGNTSDFAGWLFGIARNLALNGQRRAARRATFPHPIDDTLPLNTLLLDTVADPSGIAAGRDLTRRLLAVLPRREAEVVACVDVVGLDTAATATALGISATAVRVARHRALGRLRDLLADEPQPVEPRSIDSAIP